MDFGRVIHFLYYWKDPILDVPSVNVVLLVMGWQSTINISEFIEITQQAHSVVIMLNKYHVVVSTLKWHCVSAGNTPRPVFPLFTQVLLMILSLYGCLENCGCKLHAILSDVNQFYFTVFVKVDSVASIPLT